MLRYTSVRRGLLLIALFCVTGANAFGHDSRHNYGTSGHRQVIPTWFTFQCTSDLNTHRVTAAGTATHLGQWSADGHVDNVNFNPAADRVTISGKITIVTTNGDKLFGSVSISSRISTGQGIDTITFTGGTGRFAGASGYAILLCTVTEDPASPMVFHCQCTGPGVLILVRR